MAADSNPNLTIEVTWWDDEPDEGGFCENSPTVTTLDEAIGYLLDHKGEAAQIEIFDREPGGSLLRIRSTAEGFVVEGESRSRELRFNSDGSTQSFWETPEDFDPQDDDSQS